MTVLNPDKNPQLAEALKACPDSDDVELNQNLEGLLGQAKEMVLLVEADQIDLQAISFSLDAATGHLVLARSWRTVDLDKDDLLRVLAIATVFDVPVYPDRDENLPALTDLWSRLRTEGVELTHEGKKVRVRWTREPFATFDANIGEWVLRPTFTNTPATVDC